MSSKKTDVTKVTPAEIAIANTQNTFTLLQAAGTIPTTEFETESGGNIKFNQGETYDLVCIGLCEGADFNDREKMIEDNAVELVANDGNVWISQDAVMIAAVKKMKAREASFPRLIRVYCNGKRISAKGKEYADLTISSMDITEMMIDTLGLSK